MCFPVHPFESGAMQGIDVYFARSNPNSDLDSEPGRTPAPTPEPGQDPNPSQDPNPRSGSEPDSSFQRTFQEPLRSPSEIQPRCSLRYGVNPLW